MGELEEVKTSQLEERLRHQKENECDQLKERMETEVQKLEDCHREIDVYRGQLEESSKALDQLQQELTEEKERSGEREKQLEEVRELELRTLEERMAREMGELRQRLELEHELEFDNFKQQLGEREGE